MVVLSLLVQRKYAKKEVSSGEESHLPALTEPDVNVSAHPAPITQPTAPPCAFGFVPMSGSSHRWLSHHRNVSDTAPSLRRRYTAFNATTGRSAPVPRIGTQALAGLPLGPLPSHRGDRFPGSTRKPGPASRRLHAGRRRGSKQVSPRLIPGQRLRPGFDVISRFRQFISGSLALVFPTLT